MTFPSRAKDESVVWIVPDFILSWRDESCEWTLKPYRRSFASGDLTVLSAGGVYGFLMVAPACELEALTFDFAGPMTRANGLWVELSTVEGVVLRRAFVEASSISTYGQAPVMDLTGLRFEIGAKLHVRLSVVALDETGEVHIAATPQPSTGMAFERKVTRLRNERLFVYDRTGAVAASNVVVFPRGTSLAEARPALELLADAFPGQDFTSAHWDKLPELWTAVADAEVVAFANFHRASREPGEDYDRLCFELARRGACTIALDTETLHPSPVKDGAVERMVKAAVEDQQRCRFILRRGAQPMICGPDQPLLPMDGAPAVGRGDSLRALRERLSSAMLPKVAIVSVLYRKADIIQTFLEHIRLQTYPGPIVTVLVDDCSPEPDAALAEAFQERLEAFGHANRSVRVLRNPANGGNCQSRMNGLQAEQADIHLVMDCDCLINRDFVAAHVFEHAHPEVEVVIGPLNIEAGDRDPAQLVQALEREPHRIEREAEAQDRVQADGFLNCITRNFSIKRQALPPEGLFDLDFSYSANPDSGFGWEDVEMAYRLYARGARIRFTDKAFSVHATHPSSASEGAKIRGSMRNFERLFVKHETMALAARRWAVDTFDKIMDWADRNGVEPDDVRRRLEARFSAVREWQAPLVSVMRGRKPRLRVLSYRWHAPHQYELYKLPHDFTLATGVGDNGMVERWSYDQRPLRANARLRPASEIDPADYDVALLHFDENVLAPELCNNTIPAAWGDPFHWLLGTDLPKVAICHGTPQFVGQYGADAQRKAAFTLHEDERLRMVALMAAAGVHVVCNSHQAHAEWGFSSSQVIWHGFDPQEFPEGRGDLDILALNADRHRPHYRGAWEQMEVEARLDPGIRIDSARHFGGALEVRGTNAYATARFRAYVERIGRFKAYLNTTLRSPMPRSRGEAMMTGVVPVCLNNHDVSLFIENGVNGFYADEPGALADFLNHLCRNESEARRIRAAARRTALDVFNHDRYLTAWTELLERIAA
jgi:glycosyltransferase involved in cell wall biosynthesis